MREQYDFIKLKTNHIFVNNKKQEKTFVGAKMFNTWNILTFIVTLLHWSSNFEKYLAMLNRESRWSFMPKGHPFNEGNNGKL